MLLLFFNTSVTKLSVSVTIKLGRKSIVKHKATSSFILLIDSTILWSRNVDTLMMHCINDVYFNYKYLVSH